MSETSQNTPAASAAQNLEEEQTIQLWDLWNLVWDHK